MVTRPEMLSTAEVVEASVADSLSFEQAIGRAVVIADQMSRGVLDEAQLGNAPSSLGDAPLALGDAPLALGDAPSSSDAGDPFFAFSMADVVPDFGGEHRYWTRVRTKMARIIGTRRTVVASAVSLMLVLFSVSVYLVTQQGPSASASYRTQGISGNAQLLSNASPAVALSLPASTVPPVSAPPSLADATPLRPHEGLRVRSVLDTRSECGL